MRVIEAMIACLLLIAGLSATTYLSRVSVSVNDSNLDKTGENIFDVLCNPNVVQRIMEGGEFTETQLKTLISTLLPSDSVYSVSFVSSMANGTLLNTTNMGSGSSSSYNAFAGVGTYTISLPLSKVEYQPVDVMLVIDVSGSMGETDGSGKIKIDLAKTAAITFVNNLTMSRDRAGLVSFSTTATIKCSLTNNTNQIVNATNSLTTGGSTNMGGGISKANEEFVNHGRSNATWIMILLSDGKANVPPPDATARQYAINQSECAKVLNGKGVIIYTIGLGSSQNLDENLLKQIAFDESKYYRAPTADQLESIYLAISKDILLQVRYDVVVIQLNIFGTG
jgi:Mg-chelatase subunit ChlD